MTVHMIRICIGPQSSWSLSKAEAAVEDWMSKQSEWTTDPVEHSLEGISPDYTTAAWWQGDYRLTFESDPKDNLLQKLEDKLVNKPLWYRFGYHECEHDETDPGPCSWGEEREWMDTGVPIPSEVPDFT